MTPEQKLAKYERAIAWIEQNVMGVTIRAEALPEELKPGSGPVGRLASNQPGIQLVALAMSEVEDRELERPKMWRGSQPTSRRREPKA